VLLSWNHRTDKQNGSDRADDYERDIWPAIPLWFRLWLRHHRHGETDEQHERYRRFHQMLQSFSFRAGCPAS
jgi:hypothetical protein